MNDTMIAVKPDFIPAEHEAIKERIDRAIVEAYQCRGTSTDPEMMHRVFECLEDDGLPDPASAFSKEGANLTVPLLTARLLEWTLRKYIELRIPQMRLEGWIR